MLVWGLHGNSTFDSGPRFTMGSSDNVVVIPELPMILQSNEMIYLQIRMPNQANYYFYLFPCYIVAKTWA